MLSIFTLAAFALPALAGYVKLDVQKGQPQSQFVRRDVPVSDLDEQIKASQYRNAYFLNLTIGTPPQPFTLQLDTGSSNIWVASAKATICQESGRGCAGGTFDFSASSTANVTVPDAFFIGYADGTSDAGDYFTDVVTLGEITLDSGILSNLGLATDLEDGPKLQNDGRGLVGVGYQANQAGLEYTATDTYAPPTIIQAMVKQGEISREAYSLYLNDQDSGTGAIIFGGVDPTKYKGDLVALPVLQKPNNYSDYTELVVTLTSISFSDANGDHLLTDSGFAVEALIDSGTTQTYLPSAVMDQINKGLGVSDEYVPCSYAKSDAALVYQFGGADGPTIRVPLAAIIRDLVTTQADDGTVGCELGVGVTDTPDELTLGDSFMRSGYFVFDLENNYIAMAEAVLNATGEAITEIPTGTEIPGCTSTNTFVFTPTVAATESPPAETTPSVTGSAWVPGTPTFALGEAATATGSESGSGSGSSESGSATGSASGSSPSQGAGVKHTGLDLTTQAALAVAAIAVSFL